MKKCYFILLLTMLAFHARAYESINHWMLFTGGYSFINGKADINNTLAGSDAVNAVAEDGNGRVWMAVSGKGLRFFDGKKVIDPHIPKESIAARAEILSLAFDSKNTLWIGTTEGLVRYDGAAWTDYGPEVISMRTVTCIAITATDKVYISGMRNGAKDMVGAGISFYNGQTWTSFTRSNSAIPEDLVQDLLLDKSGRLWMTVGRHDGGIAKFDGKNWKLYNTSNTALPVNAVRALATNSSGNLWAVTPKGIVTFDGTDWKLKGFSNGYGSRLMALTRSSGTIEAISMAVEDNGTVWIGTANQGVYELRSSGVKLYGMELTPLISNAVMQIMIDKGGRKWMVTGMPNESWAGYFPKEPRTMYNGRQTGVAVLTEYGKDLDPKWHVFDNTNSDLMTGTTYAVTEDGKSNVWYANDGDGLVLVKDGRFTPYKPQKAMQVFTRMYAAPDGKIYLGTALTGIKVFADGNITDFAKSPVAAGVTDLSFDKSGTLWAAHMSGVSRYVNGEWETFNKRNSDMPSVIVYCVMKDSRGMLWIGTAKGLVKYDGTAWTVLKDVEFPSDDIRAITEDSRGRIWVGTKSGFSILDGTTWTHIPKMESIKMNRITISSISVDKAGVAWLGTDLHGLIRYDGTNYMLYDNENTGTIYDRITSVKAASDGKVYVASEMPDLNKPIGSFSQSMEANVQNSIDTKIFNSDPKHIFVIIEN